MPITVECPDCQRSYTVDESFVGRRIKCKRCGKVFTIESPAPQPLSDLDPFSNADFDESPEKTPEPKKPKFNNPIETAPPRTVPTFSLPTTARAASTPASVKPIFAVLAAFVLLSLAMGIYWTAQAYMDVKDTHIATAAAGHVWEWIILFDVLLFALLGPLMWLGIWGASKLGNFSMADLPYLRASALVALAAIIACLAEISPDLLKITLFILLVPAIYYPLKLAFGLDWAQSGIALAFGIGATLLGGFLCNLILGMVVSGSVFSEVDTARQLALAKAPQRNSAADADAPGIADTAVALPPSKDPAAYERFKQLVRDKAFVDISRSTREEHLPDLLNLKRQKASLEEAFHDQPDWADQVRAIETFEQRVMALPSGKVGDDIYADAPDADDWTTGRLSRGRLAPEVSFRQFKYQPPVQMKLDLSAAEPLTDQQTWIGTTATDARLTIRAIPRTNPRQRRPAVNEDQTIVKAAAAQGLLAVDGTNMTAQTAQINGLTVTRLMSKDGSHAAQYYFSAGNDWIVVTVTPTADQKFVRVIDAAARSLREVETGETAADPQAPALMAPRLYDDFAHASAILAREGAAGEDAVAALLASDDHAVRQSALLFLKEHATARSAAPLRHIALGQDPTEVDLAKTALSRIGTIAATQPEKAPATPPADVASGPADPAVSSVLTELRSNDAAVRKTAISELVLMKPIDSQRRAISSKLAAMMRNHDACATVDMYTQALIVWGDQGVAADLLPLLKEGGDPDSRHAVMKIAATLKLPGAAAGIAKWLRGDPVAAANALVDIGAPAEPAVLESLRDVDPSVRIEASRLLSQIGTRRCIPELTHASRDARDTNAQQAAVSALKAVNARVANDVAQPADAPK